MTAAINRLSDSELAQLEQHYQLINKREIVRFLNKNPEITPVLLELAERAAAALQPSSIELSWYSDPEYPKDQGLSVEILSSAPLSVQELFELLQQFKFDWFYKLPASVISKLRIYIYDDQDDDEL